MTVVRPRRREDVIFREVGPEEAFLYDPVNRCVHVINATAVAVWRLSDGTRELTEIAAHLMQRFDVPAEVSALEDVQTVIEQFQSLHLLLSQRAPL